MALQLVLDRTGETGDTYPAAYWRVDGLQWIRADQVVNVTVGVYRNAAAAPTKTPVVARTFTATGAAATTIITANDIQAAIYAWLKSLAQFATAIDV